MDFTVIEVERNDHVATVFLNRPEALNAFDPAMWAELPAAVAELDADPSVRAIVVAGRGRCLTSGLDLKAFGPLVASGQSLSGAEGSPVAKRRALYDEIKSMQDTFSCLANTDKPVIGVAHGWAIGAGMDLLTACDIRIAAADAVFGVRETKIAMAADVGSLQRLPRIIPAGQAAELIYTGKDIDADRALAIGLVNSVHPDGEAALAAAQELAAEIAANAPLAVQGSKHMVRANDGRTVDEALDAMALWNSSFLHSDDLREAMMAYLESRPPEFKGE
jgi:enoyl-CoA hydratase